MSAPSVLALLLSALTSIQAEDSPNARQARRIFNQAYQLVFGEQGATLRYDVNITGIYKTYGTIWYKGKKSKFVDAKMNSWNFWMYNILKSCIKYLFRAFSSYLVGGGGEDTINREWY